MNELVKEILDNIKIGYQIVLRSNVGNEIQVNEGTVTKITSSFISLDCNNSKRSIVRLEDIVSLEIVNEKKSALTDVDSDRQIETEHDGFSASETGGIIKMPDLIDGQAVEKSKGFHVLRKAKELQSLNPLTFSISTSIAEIRKLSEEIENESIKNTILDILNYLIVYDNDLTSKYQELKNSLVQCWYNCSSNHEYRTIYYLLGIVCIAAKKFKSAREPLVRARKYSVSAYASSMAKMDRDTNILLVCALLNKEYNYIDKRIADIIVNYNDTFVLRQLLNKYEFDQEFCEDIFTTTYYLFNTCKIELNRDITEDCNAIEASKYLLDLMESKKKKNTALEMAWTKFNNYYYPSTRVRNTNIQSGIITSFDVDKLFGFIDDKKAFFHVSQVIDLTSDGILLRRLLGMGLGDQLEVTYYWANDYMHKSKRVAAGIQLTEKGVREAERRFENLENNIIANKGRIKKFDKKYRKGEIDSDGRIIKFRYDGVIDPWLKKYLLDLSVSGEQDVIFCLKKGMAVDICWYKPDRSLRDAYTLLISKAEKNNWKNYITEQAKQGRTWTLSYNDPFQGQTYVNLKPIDNYDSRFCVLDWNDLPISAIIAKKKKENIVNTKNINNKINSKDKTLSSRGSTGFIADARNALNNNKLDEAERFFELAIMSGNIQEAALCDYITMYIRWEGRTEKAVELLEEYAHLLSIDKLMNVSISVYQKRKHYRMLCELYRQGIYLFDSHDKKALFFSQLTYSTLKLCEYHEVLVIYDEWKDFCDKNSSNLKYETYRHCSLQMERMRACALYFNQSLDESRKIALSILEFNPNDKTGLAILSGELVPAEKNDLPISDTEIQIIDIVKNAASIELQKKKPVKDRKNIAKKESSDNSNEKTTTTIVQDSIDLTIYEEAGYDFGIILALSNNYGRIENKYSTESINSSSTLYFEVPKIHFSTGKKPPFSNRLLLVKYRKSADNKITINGKDFDTLEDGSTITIIKEFKKSNIQYAEIVDSSLKIYHKVDVASGNNAVPLFGMGVSEYVDGLIDGENIVLTIDNYNALYKYSQIGRENYYIDDRGEKFNPSIFYGSKVWRFGCITDVNINAGIGIINNSWKFSLDVAVSILNIIKTHFSSSQPTGLYCLFTCDDNTITEIRRIKTAFDCIQWESGIVEVSNKQKSVLEILIKGQRVLHRCTIETNPHINRLTRKGEILNKDVWVRCIGMFWRDPDSLIGYCKQEIIDIHIKEQSPTVMYNEIKDIYEGVQNQTERFLITGSEQLLRQYIGRAETVVFFASKDGYSLECRLKIDNNAVEDISDIVESNIEISDNFADFPLIKLYLENANLSQTGLRYLEVDESGMPRSVEMAEHSFKLLFESRVAFPKNWLNQLVATKIALAYPDIFQGRLEKIKTTIPEILLGVLRMKMLSVARDSIVCYGELAYGLSTIIQFDTTRNNDTYNIVWLLLQDFGTVDELKTYESHKRRQNAVSLRELCRRAIPEKNIQNLVAHLLQLNIPNIEKICRNIENNNYNVTVIKKYLTEINGQIKEYTTLSEMLISIKATQRKVFWEYSKNIAEICLRKTDICDHLAQNTDTLLHRWFKTTTTDDFNRFVRFKQACENVINYKRQGGFEQQESILIHAWNELDLLEKEILDHPCKDTTEILIYNPYLTNRNNIISRAKEEITEKLCRLYSKDSMPDIVCELNEEFLPSNHFINGETNFYIIVSNGDSRQMLQSAENVVIRLESLTPGITVTPELMLDRRLNAGDEIPISVNIVADDSEAILSNDVVTIIWSVEFLYTSSFVGGHPRQSKHTVDSQSDPIILQLGLEQLEVKDCQVDNPYKEAAKGNPLKENSSIYRHRSEEYTILNCIAKKSGQVFDEFQSGATVIVHGQKKIGKTSLVKQIKAYIERNEILRDKAIIIQFDTILSNVGHVKMLPNFLQMFCDQILRRFKSELRNHEDIWLMLKDNNLEIPDLLDDSTTAYAKFSRFIDQFEELDEKKHTIILFMDEFTTLCTSLLIEIEHAKKTGNFTEVNYLQHIPDFIKDFSGKGFIQVVIGHEAMIRSLDELGMLNQTKEFATDVELMSLSPVEADALIREPMVDAFSYDPYRTSLGKRAMDYIRDLTGCHPTFLVRICNIIFDYYIDNELFPKERTQLTRIEVENAVSKYLSKLQLTDFDILLVEDGDGVEKPENRKTYKYLKCLAEVSLASYDRRTADSREVFDKMKMILGDAEEERIRNILHSRHVIKYTEGGRMRIETGLFIEYIQQRQGGRL